MELKIQALKDSQKSFDLGKFTATSKQQPIVVMDNHRPVMSFDAQGNFSEVMVRPLRVSIAAIIFDPLPMNEPTKAILAAYQSRGGKL